MPNLGVVEIFVLFVLIIGPAIAVAFYARAKGHTFIGYLLLGLVFSWIVSLVAALVVSDRRTPR